MASRSCQMMDPVCFVLSFFESNDEHLQEYEKAFEVSSNEYDNDIAEIQYANEKYYEELRDEFDQTRSNLSE